MGENPVHRITEDGDIAGAGGEVPEEEPVGNMVADRLPLAGILLDLLEALAGLLGPSLVVAGLFCGE